MQAVIRSGGKQYRVEPGNVLRVEKLPQTEGAVEFNQVLTVSDEGKLLANAGALVKATVIGQEKGEKVKVFHYKRKKQYKKLAGHRQTYTRVRIDEIVPGA